MCNTYCVDLYIGMGKTIRGTTEYESLEEALREKEKLTEHLESLGITHNPNECFSPVYPEIRVEHK